MSNTETYLQEAQNLIRAAIENHPVDELYLQSMLHEFERLLALQEENSRLRGEREKRKALERIIHNQKIPFIKKKSNLTDYNISRGMYRMKEKILKEYKALTTTPKKEGK